MADVDKKATYISPLDSIIIVDDFDEMQFTAKKFNTISFRAPVNDLISVSISGAVTYPGKYTLKADSTLGFMNYGQLQARSFFRWCYCRENR